MGQRAKRPSGATREELEAYANLARWLQRHPAGDMQVRVTGPLIKRVVTYLGFVAMRRQRVELASSSVMRCE